MDNWLFRTMVPCRSNAAQPIWPGMGEASKSNMIGRGEVEAMIEDTRTAVVICCCYVIILRDKVESIDKVFYQRDDGRLYR
jgi:hypothetical protein